MRDTTRGVIDTPSPGNVIAADGASGQFIPQGPYLLDTGDRLRVVVYGQESLSNVYAVDSTGSISMPLIGQIEVAGYSTKDVESAIGSKLRGGFIREPHVAVEVELYRPFFIMGEVTTAGQYPYVNNITAQMAIAIAGGFSPRANRQSIEVTRKVNGQLMRANVPPTHPVLPGDTIVVRERWF